MYSPPSYQRVPTSIDIPLEDRYKPQPNLDNSNAQNEEVEAGESSLKPTRYVYNPARPIVGEAVSVLADPAVHVDVSTPAFWIGRQESAQLIAVMSHVSSYSISNGADSSLLTGGDADDKTEL